jgi:hypothetical protein
VLDNTLGRHPGDRPMPVLAGVLLVPPSHRAKCRLELVWCEWLLHDWGVSVSVRQTRRAVSTGEHERYSPLDKTICHRKRCLSGQVDVEYGEIERLLLSRLERRLQPHRRPNDLVTEIGNRVFDEHGDKHLVFDYQDTWQATLLRRLAGR